MPQLRSVAMTHVMVMRFVLASVWTDMFNVKSCQWHCPVACQRLDVLQACRNAVLAHVAQWWYTMIYF